MHDRHSQDLGSGDIDTITSISSAGSGEPDPAHQPYLVVLAVCDDRRQPSSRHLLSEIDEVRFGRGARSATRGMHGASRVLELRIPDAWMSSHHGRLLRGPDGWVLDDPRSKNGLIVNGHVTRQSPVTDGALIELGHTFLLFCEQPVEAGAAADLTDGELGVEAQALATFVGPLLRALLAAIPAAGKLRFAPPARPAPAPPARTARSEQDDALRERLIGLLTVHRGNVVAVARAMDVRRTQIYRWARRLGIDLGGFRR